MEKSAIFANPPTANLLAKVSGWLAMSRPTFHIVGTLPFLLGTILAWKLDGVFNSAVFLSGALAVSLSMLATYQAGEYFDYQEDALSRKHCQNHFSGGSGVLQAGILSLTVALTTSIVSLILAGIIGLVLQFILKTGPCTVILGWTGALAGFLYSTRPVRLVSREIGEILIGFCYGWLPIASAFYIQSGYILYPCCHYLDEYARRVVNLQCHSTQRVSGLPGGPGCGQTQPSCPRREKPRRCYLRRGFDFRMAYPALLILVRRSVAFAPLLSAGHDPFCYSGDNGSAEKIRKS